MNADKDDLLFETRRFPLRSSAVIGGNLIIWVKPKADRRRQKRQ
jgi:hypothetical protein